MSSFRPSPVQFATQRLETRVTDKDINLEQYVEKVRSINVSRRGFLRAAAGLAASAALVGCAQTGGPAPTASEPTSNATTPKPGATSAAPASAWSSGGGAGEEIKIGVILPLTGGSSAIGLDCKNGADLAVEVVNSGLDLGLPRRGRGLPRAGRRQGQAGVRRPSGNPRRRARAKPRGWSCRRRPSPTSAPTSAPWR